MMASMKIPSLPKVWLGVRASVAFLRLVRDPSKLDEVFRILDGLEASGAGDEIVQGFLTDPAQAEAFERRPRLGRIDLDALARLPVGTLGRTFADEMRARGLDPSAIEQRADDGTPGGYVFAHLRETHDVWHTATAFDVDVAGELGLQAFYLGQFGAPLSLVILALGLLNTFFYARSDTRRRMEAIARGWTLGRRARPFFGYDWASRWETSLADVREELGLGQRDAPATARPQSVSLGGGASVAA